jgi:hypothetical protein
VSKSRAHRVLGRCGEASLTARPKLHLSVGNYPSATERKVISMAGNQYDAVSRNANSLNQSKASLKELNRNPDATAQQRRDAERAVQQAQAGFDAAYNQYALHMNQHNQNAKPKSYWKTS